MKELGSLLKFEVIEDFGTEYTLKLLSLNKWNLLKISFIKDDYWEPEIIAYLDMSVETLFGFHITVCPFTFRMQFLHRTYL